MNSFSPVQVLGNLLVGNMVSLSEQISEGKSGSLFLWTQNSRFAIKTISKDERGVCLSFRY